MRVFVARTYYPGLETLAAIGSTGTPMVLLPGTRAARTHARAYVRGVK